MRIKSLLFALLCGAYFLPEVHPQSYDLPRYQGLRVLSQTPSSVTFEYVPQFTARERVNESGQTLKYYSIDAELSGDKPGAPPLPRLSLPLTFPSTGATLRILSVMTTDSLVSDFLAVPDFIRDNEGGALPQYAQLRFRGREGLTPENPCVLMPPVGSRGIYVGSLIFYPIQFRPSERIVRFYTKIVVQVSSAGAFPGGRSFTEFIEKNVFRFKSQAKPAYGLKRAVQSPLANGDWYKVEITDDGIYKLDRAFFRNSGIAVQTIDAVRIFGTPGTPLSESLTAPMVRKPEEVSRYVADNNGNGIFDDDDFILFYATGPSGWVYSPSTGTYTHYVSPYVTANTYFITVDQVQNGKSMSTLASGSQPNPFRPQTFKGKVFFEQEKVNLLRSGREWFGNEFVYDRNTLLVTNSLPGLNKSNPITYRFVFLSRSTTLDTFNVYDNNVYLGLVYTFPTYTASIQNDYAYRSPLTEFIGSGNLPDSRSVLKIVFGTNNQGAKGWIDYAEILYDRNFEASQDLLRFGGIDRAGDVEFTVRGFSSRQILVFEVSDHANVKRITGTAFDTADPSAIIFQLPQQAGSPMEFIAVGPNGAKTPPVAKKIPNSNLAGITEGAQMVIVSPPEFLSEARRLKAHRESYPGNQLLVLIAQTDQIYNEFSGGLVDPMAIRNFLKHAVETWTIKPEYLLLFGAGHFDFRNISTSAPNYVPVYESAESIHQIGTHASDDYFVILNPLRPVQSLAVGRIPARSLAEASEAVSRIISYESAETFESWRNRITFIADDGLTTTDDDRWLHTSQSENLSKLPYTPLSFERNKIFIVDYPTVNTAAGRRKPAANEAIIEAFNRGTVILNYTGHGNPEVWAHEQVFTRDGSIPRLTNTSRFPFLVAATCDFARYDDPFDQSAGERLLFLPSGGSIATVTASRPVYSLENDALNKELYRHLFKKDTAGNAMRLGDALWAVKQNFYGLNDIKFSLLGDPSLRIAIPRTSVGVDSVNSISAAQAVVVPAMGKVLVKASVLSPDSLLLSGFNGRAIVEMYDAMKINPVPIWGSFTYITNGSLLYRGVASIRNGRLEAEFPVPKDVSYRPANARISFYAWSDSIDGAGFTENLTISGSDSLAAPDTVGPVMSVFLHDRAFRNGDIIPPTTELIVDLEDVNGINTSAAGIGHRLEAKLSSAPTLIDLSNYYRGNLDTYRSGEIRYPLAGLPEGRHSVLVKAWDTRNNSSQSEVSFEVKSQTELALYDVVNYPNPMKDVTSFTFRKSGTEAVDIVIKIYTVAGRLIKTINGGLVTDRFTVIPWDGRDDDGDRIGNGVYLYKIIARGAEDGRTVETLGKLAVLR